MRMLDKDPLKRRLAFESLKEHVGVESTTATRAPFIGRGVLLKETLDFLNRQPSKSLRVLVIEAAPGIGKSRFIEELRMRCGFENLLFSATCCISNSADFHPFLQPIREILRTI